MAGVSIKIEGAREISSSLKALPGKVAKGIMRRTLRAGAKIVLAQARANAPVKSGALRRSLKVRAGKRKRGRISMLVQSSEGAFKGDEFYGSFVELGWKHGNRQRGGNRKQIAGKFFLHAAYKESSAAAADAVSTTSIAEIEKEALK